MQQDFQYSIKLRLFDDGIISIVIMMLPFHHYCNNFFVDKLIKYISNIFYASDDIIYCWQI